jgi:hypothetical protein
MAGDLQGSAAGFLTSWSQKTPQARQSHPSRHQICLASRVSILVLARGTVLCCIQHDSSVIVMFA